MNKFLLTLTSQLLILFLVTLLIITASSVIFGDELVRAASDSVISAVKGLFTK